MQRRRLLAASAGACVLPLTACMQLPDRPPGATGARRPPDLPSTALRRIAFGSCIDQNRPQPIWGPILAAKPDLFIFGGDNVYASAPPWSRDRLEQAYAKLAADPGFARLRTTVPHLATWDDHDYGLNDGGAGFSGQQAAQHAFLAFWGAAADDARHARPGVHHAVRLGPPGRRVQIILLDGRTFRSPLRPTDRPMAPGRERYLPDPDPAKTMLGDAQWAWLEAQWMLPADLRLVVSGVQVLAEGHGWECWGNLPRERQRLLDLARHDRAGGVVFLSGDRHVGGIYRQDAAGREPLYEVTSSGMTHAWAQAREVGPNRIGELVRENHFAQLDLDWAARSMQITFKDATGAVLRTLTVRLAAAQT